MRLTLSIMRGLKTVFTEIGALGSNGVKSRLSNENIAGLNWLLYRGMTCYARYPRIR